MADSWCDVTYIGATHVTIVTSSNGDHGKKRELPIAHKRQPPTCKSALSAVSVAKGALSPTGSALARTGLSPLTNRNWVIPVEYSCFLHPPFLAKIGYIP